MPRTAPESTARQRAGQSWRALRRAVLRRRRLLAALCLGVAVLAGLRALSPSPEPTSQVLVAAHDLEAGAVLSAEDLTSAQWPVDATPRGLANVDEAIGRTVTGPVRAGEPVTDVRLVTASLLEGYPELEAVPVRIPDAAVASLLRVGDRIDLLATDQRTGDTERVGEELPVLAMPAEKSSVAANGLQGTLIVVGTTPEMSEKVASSTATRYLTALISR